MVEGQVNSSIAGTLNREKIGRQEQYKIIPYCNRGTSIRERHSYIHYTSAKTGVGGARLRLSVCSTANRYSTNSLSTKSIERFAQAAMATQLLPLELIDRCVGSPIRIIMKGDKGVQNTQYLNTQPHIF